MFEIMSNLFGNLMNLFFLESTKIPFWNKPKPPPEATPKHVDEPSSKSNKGTMKGENLFNNMGLIPKGLTYLYCNSFLVTSIS